jgi:hypothetical protein
MDYLWDILQYILGLIAIVIIWRIFKLQAQKHKNWNHLFKQGAISGGISVLLGIGLYQLPLLGTAPYLLVAALIGAVVLGLPVGGIGGLIVGSIWKHDKAAIFGGSIIALILLAIGIGLAPFVLLGGY